MVDDLTSEERKGMTVGELIEALTELPADKEVWVLWDGACRSKVHEVYVAKDGHAVLKDVAEPIYYENDKPAD